MSGVQCFALIISICNKAVSQTYLELLSAQEERNFSLLTSSQKLLSFALDCSSVSFCSSITSMSIPLGKEIACYIFVDTVSVSMKKKWICDEFDKALYKHFLKMPVKCYGYLVQINTELLRISFSHILCHCCHVWKVTVSQFRGSRTHFGFECIDGSYHMCQLFVFALQF